MLDLYVYYSTFSCLACVRSFYVKTSHINMKIKEEEDKSNKLKDIEVLRK